MPSGYPGVERGSQFLGAGDFSLGFDHASPEAGGGWGNITLTSISCGGGKEALG